MIKLVKSSFYHEAETKQALADFIIGADQFSFGEQCRTFEAAFAAKQGTKHAIFVTSGSAANLILVQALLNMGRLQPGARVGFSALTWATNVMPLIQLGLVPVPLDCSLETLNVSPGTVAKVLDSVDCIFLTNVLGFCDDIGAIRALCADKGVILLEDNCESLGSQVGGEMLGNFGLASTFSFFVGHHLSTIEGGMVCTNDDELQMNLVMARAHGWSRHLTSEQQVMLRDKNNVDEFYDKYTFYDLAYNTRPNEVNAFIGNVQLPYWDEIVSRRADNFAALQAAVLANPDFIPVNVGHMSVVSNFAMPIVCRTQQLAEQYRQRFVEAGVEVRPVIAGSMTRQPFYKKYVADLAVCPNADLVHENGFYFGNNPELTGDDLALLTKLLQS